MKIKCYILYSIHYIKLGFYDNVSMEKDINDYRINIFNLEDLEGVFYILDDNNFNFREVENLNEFLNELCKRLEKWNTMFINLFITKCYMKFADF